MVCLATNHGRSFHEINEQSWFYVWAEKNDAHDKYNQPEWISDWKPHSFLFNECLFCELSHSMRQLYMGYRRAKTRKSIRTKSEESDASTSDVTQLCT